MNGDFSAAGDCDASVGEEVKLRRRRGIEDRLEVFGESSHGGDVGREGGFGRERFGVGDIAYAAAVPATEVVGI